MLTKDKEQMAKILKKEPVVEGETMEPTKGSSGLDEETLEISDEFLKSSADEVRALKATINKLEAKVASHWDKALRATSELDNMRRRAERDVAKAHKFANEDFMRSLLPIMDSLEQAANIEEGDQTHLKEGLELTIKLFTDTLTKHKVVILDPVGKPFDPKLHEAMTMHPSDELEPGMVISVFQKGYQLADRVIRPARVIVSSESK